MDSKDVLWPLIAVNLDQLAQQQQSLPPPPKPLLPESDWWKHKRVVYSQQCLSEQ